MMLQNPTAHPPAGKPGEWERLKDEIHDLYIREARSLEGAGGVMEILKSRYGFVRSKSQFVAQLGKWGYRKYSKETPAAHWKAANYKTTKARRSGKKVQLLHNGKVVTEKVRRTKGYLTAIEQACFDGKPRLHCLPLHSTNRVLTYHCCCTVSAMSPQTPPEFKVMVETPPPAVLPVSPFSDFWATFTHFAAGTDALIDVENTFNRLQASKPFLCIPAAHRIGALLPEYGVLPRADYDDDIKHQEVTADHQFQLITYLLSNNLQILPDDWLGRNSWDAARQAMILALKTLDAARVLNTASLSKNPCSKSLLESMFRVSIETEDIPAVRYLLENGMNPNGHHCDFPKLPTESHFTPLQFALLSGNLVMARLLLDYGANIDAPGTRWKSSAIVLAIIGWRLRPTPQARYFDDMDPTPDEQSRDEITLFVRFLVDRGARVNAEELQIGPKDAFKGSWIDRCWLPRPAMGWYSPLSIASRYGLGELVDMMINKNCLCHEYRQEELNSAFSDAFHDCVKWCILEDDEYYSDRDLLDPRPTGFNDTAFLFSRLSADEPRFPLSTIHCLLRAGADPLEDIVYWDSDTENYMDPVVLTAYSPAWSLDALELLLENGAEPTCLAFQTCIEKFNYEAFSLLYPTQDDHIVELGMHKELANLKPSQAQWIIRMLHEARNPSLQLEILEVAIENCSTAVCSALLNTSTRVAGLIARNMVYCAPRVLGAVSLGILQRLFGRDLDNTEYSAKEFGILLYWSVVYDNTALAEFLIYGGVLVDEIVDDGTRLDTALCASIRLRNLKMFDLLIERGAKLILPAGTAKCGRQQYVNALMVAIECENATCVQLLLENGADINAYGISKALGDEFWQKTKFGDVSGLCEEPPRCRCATPLVAYLLIGSNLRFIHSLLNLGAKPNNPVESLTASGKHLTPLAAILLSPIHRYMESEHKFSVTNALLDAGASPQDPLAILSPSLRGSASSDTLKALLWRLLSQVTPENVEIMKHDRDFYPHPLGVALTNDFIGVSIAQPDFQSVVDITQSLLQAGCVPEGAVRLGQSKWISPIHTAIALEGADVLEVLLEAGVRLAPEDNTQYGSPLQLAVSADSEPLEKVKILFNYRLQNMTSPLSIRCCNLRRDAITENALQTAVVRRVPAVAEFLISNGADVNAAGNDTQGATALQFALIEKQFDIAEMMIDRGADVNAAPSSLTGMTCLEAVSAEGNLDWVKLLVRSGADTNPPRHPAINQSNTALQHAAKGGFLDVVRYLLDHGADVNAAAAPHAGATALQHAARHGLHAIAELLIRRGADVDAAPAAEQGGRTALEAAAENGRVDLVQLLLDHDAGLGPGQEAQVGRAMAMAEDNGFFAIRDMIKVHFSQE
ncbi:ankyrin repeat-containing domain protein [Xylariales sp. PMI_506]|nr:ankyrin repeat-containing domain protein [Xylariales sp. PMI_506]